MYKCFWEKLLSLPETKSAMETKDKEIALLRAELDSLKQMVYDYYHSTQRLIKIASIALLLGLITGLLL
jgi:ribosome recycling factor